jgi:hypothetical protein
MLAFLLAVATLTHEHEHMHAAGAAESIFLQQASGTSVAPAGEAVPMTMFRSGSWNVMLHGIAFLNDTHQSGFRGRDRTFLDQLGNADG